jgi:hypothetical protein
LGALVVSVAEPLSAWAQDANSGSEATKANSGRPISLIFDTDIGNDVDDVLALGVIHALMSRGECELLAVTVTKDEHLSAPFVDAINTFYGRGNIPIGVVKNGRTPEPSKFTGLAEEKDGDRLRYPHKLLDGSQAPDAVRGAGRKCGDGAGGVFDELGATTGVAAGRRVQPVGRNIGEAEGAAVVGDGRFVCRGEAAGGIQRDERCTRSANPGGRLAHANGV